MSLLSSKNTATVKNSKQFTNNLTKYIKAGVTTFIVRTREPYRCQGVIHEMAISMNVPFKLWTVLDGWQKFSSSSNDAHYNQTAKTIEEIDITRPIGQDNVIDFNGALKKMAADKVEFPPLGFYCAISPQWWLETPSIQQFVKQHTHLLGGDDRKRLILIVPNAYTIPANMESDVQIIDFDTPSHAELKRIWNNSISDYYLDAKTKKPLPDAFKHFSSEQVNLVVQNALGMTHYEFDNALALAAVQFRERAVSTAKDRVTVDEMVKHIMSIKIEIIKKNDLLELMPSAKLTDVGGLGNLKEWLTHRSDAFGDDAKEFGIEPPKGVLVVGPPGCGKSLIGKAASSILGIPCVKLDIGRVFGSLVGQSEEQMRKALKMVEAMAPCVLLIDEVDKGLGGIGGSSGDSGVSSRVFGTLLTWLQERDSTKSPVFTIMTANNVMGLPPELMRRGRLDEIFAVTFPTEEERADIIKIHVERRGHELTDSEYLRIAEHTVDYVGAELEAIVKDALIASFHKKEKTLTADEVIRQAKGLVPLSKAFADKVKAMETWARNNAKPASNYNTVSEGAAPINDDSINRSGGNKLRTIKRPKVRDISN
jgi:SpoVK/Ycf46/Vps4 family AAA+-type ATPase